MLALLVVLALGQCSKDTDCKGQRICVRGTCAGDAPFADPFAPTKADLVQGVQLRRELADLEEEYEEDNLVSPVLKLAFGIGLGVLTSVLWGTAGQYDSGTATAMVLGGLASGIVGLVFTLWGGIQLPLRMNSRAKLADAITDKKEQLDALGVDQAPPR